MLVKEFEHEGLIFEVGGRIEQFLLVIASLSELATPGKLSGLAMAGLRKGP